MPKRIVQRQSQTIYDDEADQPRTRRKRRNDLGAKVIIFASFAGGFALSWVFLPQTGWIHSANDLGLWSFIVAVAVGLLAKRYVQ